MSGGVDSSVAAALLKEQGHEIEGMMLRLWSQPGKESENACCTLESLSLAEQVANQLDIPFYIIDAKEPFRDIVVDYFIDSYARGETPNPCLMCNRHIRWGILLAEALKLGADFIATGHYVQTRFILPTGEKYQFPLNALSAAPGGVFENSEVQLLRGADKGKDQAYVLHVLTQEQLKKSIFPIGQYPKSEIRELAHKFNLPVAEKADSQDLCFLSGGDYRDFLREYAPNTTQKGKIINSEGKILGEHQGLALYTIGQRKGLGISSPNSLYVLRKDLERNALVVGEWTELGKSEMRVANINWIGAAPTSNFRTQVKIRYGAKNAWAEITPLSGTQAKIAFETAQRGISPGQAAVFYQDEICLGGGIIQLT